MQRWLALAVIVTLYLTYLAASELLDCYDKKDWEGLLICFTCLIFLIPVDAYVLLMTGDAPHVSLTQ